MSIEIRGLYIGERTVSSCHLRFVVGWAVYIYLFIYVRTNNIFDLTHCNLVRNLSDDRLLLRALGIVYGMHVHSAQK